MRPVLILLAALPAAARAEAVVATHVLRAGSVVAAADVTLVEADIPGALASVEAALGLEVKETIYAGRPVAAGALGPVAVIARNQIVSLLYSRGGLAILAEGRALARGGVGEEIKVMNTSSHSTVTGVIGADGMVRVNTDEE